MPTAIDHVADVGGLTLEERPFDAIDSLILTQIVYMPMEGFLDQGGEATLAQLWVFLQNHYTEDSFDIFQKKRFALTGACAAQDRYRDWRLHHYVNRVEPEREMQFCACAFDLPGPEMVIAFRGTDLSLAGWKEDLNMSFMTVPSQRLAAEYVEQLARAGGREFILAGHSKGGNLAVYAASAVCEDTQNKIRRIDSFDGPGFDQGTLNSHGFQRILGRIESYLPQSSVVGMLLYDHPPYTVVQSKSLGILQHDAMTWQIREGAFVTLEGLDLVSKLTDETLHAWLAGMDNSSRRLLVDTLYQVVGAAQMDTVSGLVEDWRDSSLKMLEALRELDPQVRKSVRGMLVKLFSTGAAGALRAILPHNLLGSLQQREDSRRQGE